MKFEVFVCDLERQDTDMYDLHCADMESAKAAAVERHSVALASLQLDTQQLTDQPHRSQFVVFGGTGAVRLLVDVRRVPVEQGSHPPGPTLER